MLPQATARTIVLTGGPGAGKSVIAQRIARDDPQRFVMVPEAATQVYAALQSRWDRLDLPARREAQRRIYHLQREQEERLAEAHPDALLLLDRGTLDCAAYWPDGPDAFLLDRGATRDAELARYGHVIWLETGATLGIYDGHDSNACRFEDPAAAIESGRRVHGLWNRHPSFHTVGAYAKLDDKVAAVRAALAGIAARLNR